MKICKIVAFAAVCISVCAVEGGNVISFDKPAVDWQREALPIGNGREGCMIFGGVETEHIQFNEDTLWIGDENDTGAYQAFGDLYINLGRKMPKAGLSSPSNQATSPSQTIKSSIDDIVISSLLVIKWIAI